MSEPVADTRGGSMNFWARLRSWVRTLLRRSCLESEMDTELRLHIQAYTEDLVRGGVPPEDAQRRARLEFGGLEQVKEECREARGVLWLDVAVQDTRVALRALRKSPGFSATAILTLALGIGANTAIFHLIDAVRLRSLPVPNPTELARIQ